MTWRGIISIWGKRSATGSLLTAGTPRRRARPKRVAGNTVAVDRQLTDRAVNAQLVAESAELALRRVLVEDGSDELARHLMVRPVLVLVDARLPGTDCLRGVPITTSETLAKDLQPTGRCSESSAAGQ